MPDWSQSYPIRTLALSGYRLRLCDLDRDPEPVRLRLVDRLAADDVRRGFALDDVRRDLAADDVRRGFALDDVRRAALDFLPWAAAFTCFCSRSRSF
jgi:hypothetical protein